MNRSAASKPTGVWDVRRKIKIPALVHEADAMMVEGRVGSLPGVRSVAADVQKHQLTVCYDVTGSDYQSIIELLEDTGFPPLNNWLTRRKKAGISTLKQPPGRTRKLRHQPAVTNHPNRYAAVKRSLEPHPNPTACTRRKISRSRSSKTWQRRGSSFGKWRLT